MSVWCTPRHMVSYRGAFYEAEEPFPIDPADVDEMAQYGRIEQDEEEPEPLREEPEPVQEQPEPLREEPARRRRRT